MVRKGCARSDRRKNAPHGGFPGRDLCPWSICCEWCIRNVPVTDAVIDTAKEWQNRPLEPLYAIVFMDALFLKLRTDGRVKNVAASLMVGIGLEGRKECLGT